MHEIITLQLGQRSNYLATHFWNTQESYFTYAEDEESLVDHDIHFRPGIGADGADTFTPRTLIYDLKGGFGSLKKINALYEIEEPAISQGIWNGPAVVQRQAAIQQTPYQQSLEEGSVPPELTKESVRYWSDFNRLFFHPRSIVQLNDYELSSTLMPFESWNVGEELFHSLDKEHDLLDRDLRPFAEEADHMQGIQMISSIDDAWGGYAASYIDRIRDEYGKTTISFWGLEDSLRATPREKRFIKLSNTARSIAVIAARASLFVPITLPSASLPSYVAIDPLSQWHVSGLFSAALESMTLPSRLKQHDGSRVTMDHLINTLNVNGNQNIAKLRMSVDQEMAANGYHVPGRPETIVDTRVSRNEGKMDISEPGKDEEPDILDMDFFPTETGEPVGRQNAHKKVHVFGQSGSHRSERETALLDQEDPDGYTRTRRRAAGLPIVQKTRTSLPFPLLDSFPKIFARSEESSSLGIRASLSTDTAVALRIKDLRNIVGRAIGMDEREDLSNSLGVIAGAYEEGWDSGSDEDDD